MKTILLFLLVLMFIVNVTISLRIPLKVKNRSQQSHQNRQQQQTIRIDCNTFCRASRFHGILGGCRCGYVLFVKRNEQETPPDEKSNNLVSLLPLDNFNRW